MIRSPAGFDGGDRIKRYLDYYQPSYGVMMLSAGQFSPASLFAAGEQGAWYDPSDFSTMFQDSAGTTPVTAVEQPVGLILDKSKGLALGSELVSNGDFSNGTTGWSPANANITIAVVGGVGEMTSSVSNIYVAQTVNVTSGKTYIVTGQGRAGTAPLLPLVVSGGVVLGTQINSSASLQPISFIFVAGAATASLRFQVQSGSGGTAYFDNISVKELPGNHASQSTSASRPVLSARVNLLTYSEQFDNAAWAKSGLLAFGSGSTINAVVSPNGLQTADLLVESTALSNHGVYQSAANQVSSTFSFYAKAAGRNFVALRLYTTINDWVTHVFDLSIGTRTQTSAGSASTYSAVSSSIQAANNGFYRISLSAVRASGTTFYAIDFCTSGTPTLVSATGDQNYTGDGTSGIYIWGADLRVTNDGVGIPAYQRVAAATDYDTSGFPLYLRFDGTDDSLATASVDFSATDKMTVWAGVRKLSDATQMVIVETGAGVVADNGSFLLQSQANQGYTFTSKGTIRADALAQTYTAPITNVITNIGNISGDISRIRVNGLQITENLTDQGTGNYGNLALNIGRRGGATLPYNGRLYSLIIRGAQSTDAQIASTETWVNGKTKAY